MPQTVPLTEAAATHTTELAVGDRLTVTLAENITTGFSWTLDGKACSDALHLDVDQPAPPPAGSPPGAGGHRTWTFSAVREARCELHFQYARPWEKEATGTSLMFPIAIHKGA